MDVKKSISAAQRDLGCVCLRLAAEDEEDRILDIAACLHGNKEEGDKYYSLVSFWSSMSLIKVRKSNIGIN